MVNYKSFRTLWIMSVAFCLTSIAFNWSDIPKQGIESFPLITFPGVIIFALTFLIIGMVMGLGKPKEKMPPTNKKFKVGYVKMIMEGDKKKLIILLESEKDITTQHKLPITVFERTENFSELVGLQIRNVYGTIEEVQS